MPESLRIAIIDDEPDIADVLALAARSAGHRALATSCPSALLEACREGMDLAVLDLSMPAMSGLALLESIARCAAPPRILLMSGLDEGVREATRSFASQLGLRVIGTLGKPFGPRMFLEVIATSSRVQRSFSVHAGAPTLDAEAVRRALDEDLIEVLLQPQVSLTDMRIVGAEALVRLRNEDRSLSAPDAFLRAARDGGLMDTLTIRVIGKSLAALTRLSRIAPTLSVSVNVPAQTLASRWLTDHVLDALAAHALTAERLTLEITEDELTVPDLPTLRSLLSLRLAGVRFSIDDFGTGHSTLSQTNRIPANELKIDKSLVAEVRDSARAEVIVRGVARLGRELGMRVVAEGVENEQTAATLRALGCTRAQGFYFGRPMPVAELEARLCADASVRATA